MPGSALGVRADREGQCFIKPTSKGKGPGDPSHRQSFEVKFQWCVALLGSSCLVRKMNDERSEKKNWAGAIDTSSQIFDVAKFLNRLF